MVAPASTLSRPFARRSLLIAEHEESLRRDLDSLFGTEGYETHLAEDDASAVEIVHRERIDVVILDIELPHGGGLSVLRVIRSVVGARVPCVLTASDVTSRLQVSAFLEDVFTVVPKPPDDALLKRVVDMALRRYRLL